MKVQKAREDLKDLDKNELKIKVEAFRKELFGLRLNVSTTHIKDYSQFMKLRRSVARTLTYLKQAETSK